MAFNFLLASLSILVFSWSSHADMIADICAQSSSQAISPTTCARYIRSDPHSHGADLGTLGQISIKIAKVALKNTATVAKSIRDLNNTGEISYCVRLCSSAIDDLNTVAETLKHMTKRDKDDMPIMLSGIVSDVGWCDNNFEMNPGDRMPADLKEASKIAQGLILVVLIIAGML
ncbi:pectinesterase inhibitor 2-like [Salvia hispanica]|uniref:pectinesterase inhibitor 2-like n=1 Tax=Salvia hispanica TaxID=49212 RepID=UPI002009853E|nr:pectinesterase inhibitor 2-like [Salvia hispanica]